jgi:bacterioferritin-associated ferredoxin
VTKMLDMACSSGSCCGSCPRVVAQAVTDARGCAGIRTEVLAPTTEAAPNRDDASLVKKYEAGFLKTLGLYRELVGLEISRASEYGARWWSRRLVDMSEEAGLVRLDE